MIRQTLVVLGITVVVAGYSPIAKGQSAPPFSSGNNSVMLSGQSLRTVQNRTISDDYQKFFNATSSPVPSNSGATVGKMTSSGSQSGLNDQLEGVVGDTLNSQDTRRLFSPAGDMGDSERARLQLPLKN